MDGLLERRMVVLAGKGGVGKTTTSCAVAMEAARMGRRTLVVTVDPARRLEDALGVPVGPRPTPVLEGLDAMMLDPEDVLREHLERELPQLEVTEHPLFRYVAGALPGLNELMAIGKLNDLRKRAEYDVIVVDTAPTGHALSFLGVPKAMQEVMGDRSILKWAMRGYQVWQRLQGVAGTVQNVFRRPAERKDAAPEVDFEAVFKDIQEEAARVQAFMTDPEHTALVLVCLPEKLPVEETVDLHEAVTRGLGMTVRAVVVNKVQPDPLAGVQDRFDAVAGDPKARRSFVRRAAKAVKEPEALLEAMVEAAEFGEVRRAMNLSYMEDLARRLPGVPAVIVPLFKRDVQGLEHLERFRRELFRDGHSEDAGAGRPGRS